MMAFWDTSAILPLIFLESHSPAASQAAMLSVTRYAWRWALVEAQAAVARRGARASDWEALERILSEFEYIDLSVAQVGEVGRLNRDWRLRAADAGHLYCFQQVSVVLPDAQLICFDDEITTAAGSLGLAVWQPPEEGQEASSGMVRESAGQYVASAGRKKKHVAPV